ncbi:hypothetical protein D3C78_1858970 [compost metagenome]
MCDHLLAMSREGIALTSTIDQAYAQFLLQSLQAATQGRLGQAERLSGLAKGLMLGERQEMAKVIQVQGLHSVIRIMKI